jgi:predicted HTH transcriptional regulator
VPQDLANHIIGFANADGGMIVVGLRDGQVEGTDGRPQGIADWQQAAGLADPLYHQTAGSARVTLFSAPIDRALEERLPRGARDLLRIVREAGRASTGEIVEATGRSRPLVLRQLHALEDASLVSWNGHSRKDPRACWSLRIE